MGKTSRNKGKRGELEWARFCTEQGYSCRRTGQFRGNTGQAADVEGMPGIHQEIKRTEAFRLYDALEQSTHDAVMADDGLPIVAYRKNDHPWVVIMDARDWFELYKAWEQGERGCE